MKFFLGILISVLLALGLFHLLQKKDVASSSGEAFERVMSSGKLRCGYALWAKYLDMDPNSRKLSGLAYDYVEMLAASINLKVEWTEEVGWAEFAEALKQGRIDAFCFTAFQNAQRGRVVNFVRPIAFTPMHAYARTGDARFDDNYDALNDPNVTVATVDGTTGDYTASQYSANAKKFALPEMSDNAQMFMNVVDKKADFTYADTSTFLAFDRNNPNVLRQVDGAPLLLLGVGLAVAKGEYDLQEMLNTATGQIIGMDRIPILLEKNGFAPGEVFPAKLDY